jgi:hypothetical protein
MQLRQTDKKKMKYIVFLKRKGNLKYKVLMFIGGEKNKSYVYFFPQMMKYLF